MSLILAGDFTQIDGVNRQSLMEIQQMEIIPLYN